MKTICLLTLNVFVFSVLSFAQEVIINKLSSNKNRIFTCFDDSSSLIIESEKREGIYVGDSELELCYSNYLGEVTSGNVNLKTSNGRGRFLNATLFKGRIIVVFYVQGQKYCKSYYQEYDNTCRPISEPILISEYEIDNVSGVSEFSSLFSLNGKFLSVEYWKIDQLKVNSSLEYTILDLEEGSTKKGKELIPFCESLIDKFQKKMTNNGQYIIGFPIFELGDNGFRTGKYSKFAIYRYENEHFLKSEVDVENQQVESVKMLVKEDATLCYILSEYRDKSIRRVFHVKFDLQKGKEISIDKLSITSDLDYFKIKNVFLNQDQSFIYTLERESFNNYSTENTINGTAVTTPKDYYGPLLVFKVVGSRIEWKTYINKHQAFLSHNNLLKYGSFNFHRGNKKYYIFFNDNVANYNSQNESVLKKGKNMKDFRLFSEEIKVTNKYGVAMAEIDLETGSVKRKLITRRSGVIPFGSPRSFIDTPRGVVFILKNGENSLTSRVEVVIT